MKLQNDIDAALRSVLDPEMPINIVDLGLVERVAIKLRPGGAAVTIDLLPTFVGCPALAMIEGMVKDAVGGVDGIGAVSVRFLNDPPWSVDRISGEGREALRAFGVTAPARRDPALTPLTVASRPVDAPPPKCPFCGAAEVTLESRFGPTRCKMIYYCDACRNTFEHLKPV